MALSERERKLLEEMERGLYASEADSLPTTGGSRSTPSYRAIVIGVLLVLAGVGILIGGVATGYIWLGLIGFLAMLGGVLYMFSPKNRVEGDRESAESGNPTAPESFTDRFERRWGERMDGER